MRTVVLAFVMFFHCCLCFSQDVTINKISIDTIKGQIVFNSCDLSPFMLDDGKMGIKYTQAGGLENYFFHKLDSTLLKDIQGEILIQALINKKGGICCKTISSPTGLDINLLRSLKLDEIINSMPKWQAAVLDGRKWNASILISIVLNRNGQNKIKLNHMEK